MKYRREYHPHYSIKNLPIDNEEIAFLKDAIHILRQVNDFKILGDVDAIINKLQNTVQTNIEGGASIVQFEKHTIALGTEYIDKIFDATTEFSKEKELLLRLKTQ